MAEASSVRYAGTLEAFRQDIVVEAGTNTGISLPVFVDSSDTGKLATLKSTDPADREAYLVGGGWALKAQARRHGDAVLLVEWSIEAGTLSLREDGRLLLKVLGSDSANWTFGSAPWDLVASLPSTDGAHPLLLTLVRGFLQVQRTRITVP